MTSRTYGQHCGLAMAMDLLGGRWTLLIVRDLLPGPLRYQDLLDGLPGIATDLLTTRLRSLESAGLVARRSLDAPGRGKVYELTDRGATLRPIVEALALWGGDLLPEPAAPSSYRIDPRWALASMAAAYPAGDDELPAGDYRFTFADRDESSTTMTITIGAEGAMLRYGRREATPTLAVSGPMLPLLGVLSGRSEPTDVDLGIDGDEALLERVVAAMPAPRGTPPGVSGV